MPRIELMTWQPRQRRWIKKYNGKQHVVSCRQLGCEPTREASRTLANQWWTDKLATLYQPSKLAWQALSESLSKSSDISRRNGNLAHLASVETEQAIVSRLCSERIDFPSELYEQIAGESQDETIRLDRLAILESRRQRALGRLAADLPVTDDFQIATVPAPRKRHTLRETIDAFLADKLREVNRNELTPGRYDALARYVRYFETWLVATLEKHSADEVSTNSIDESTLPDYRAHVETEQTDKKWTNTFASGLLAGIRQFIQFAWMRKHLENLPRNFADKKLRISVTNTRPIALSVEISKRLLATENEHTRLYVLLALNCAMTQTDISDLENQQIDWTNGRVKRKRSKTGHFATVPLVDYPLWTETFRLLSKLRNSDRAPESRVLVNRNGQPLKSETLKDFNKAGRVSKQVRRSDAIRNAIFRAAKALTVSPMPTFKQLRKTGATTLKDLAIDVELRTHYLGHSPRSIREGDYEGESPAFQARFDAAITKLGQQFGQ